MPSQIFALSSHCCRFFEVFRHACYRIGMALALGVEIFNIPRVRRVGRSSHINISTHQNAIYATK